MILTQLKLCSRPFMVRFQPMSKRSFFQAAHLESRQLQYQKATQRLADRAAHTRLAEDMMQVKRAADEKHKSIGALQSSGDELKQKISNVSARRETLLAELRQVEDALTQAQ